MTGLSNLMRLLWPLTTTIFGALMVVTPAAALSEEGAIAAVERFIAAWNSRDPAAFAATLHYPHVRPTPEGGSRVFATAEEYAASVDFDRVLATGWRKSRYDALEVVHLGEKKAHVAGRYTRYREDGTKIWSNQVTYVVTEKDGSAGIQARFAAGLAGLEASAAGENATKAKEAVRRYLEAFNARDEEAWVATFHFPHVRLAGDSVRVWQTPEEYMEAFDFDTFAQRYFWSRSEWDSIEAVQVGERGVNVALTATRYDPADHPLHSFQTFYLVTEENGRWGVRARSSFAP